MYLGVGRHFDLEVAASLCTDKCHQVAGVMELAACAIPTRQVAPQSHQALHAHGLEGGELFAHRLARGANARKMRGSTDSFCQDFTHGAKRALLGRTAGSVGHRAKVRMQDVQLLAHCAQLVGTFRGLGWKKLETHRKTGALCAGSSHAALLA
ncbi:hypothetical protein D3C71_1768260 [compost metagenome]